MALTRLDTLVTGICSTAPAEVLATTAVSPTLLRLGITTPWAPAHSAVRKMAPRLLGSVNSSHKMMSGASPRLLAFSRMSSKDT